MTAPKYEVKRFNMIQSENKYKPVIKHEICSQINKEIYKPKTAIQDTDLK